MKRSLSLISAAFAAILSLSLVACGGGGGGSSTPVAVPDDVTTLTKTDTVVGTGATAALGQTITVNYTGWLYSATAADHHGTKFDASADHGGAATFALSQVIDGWVQGIPGMKVGGKRTLIIPSSLGYGSRGSGSTIPPNAGLVFDVELVAIK